MTYWFVKSQPRPQSLKFTYDTLQQEKTRQNLTALLTQLTGWLQRYQDKGIDFPQVAESTGRCHECNFAIRCHRTSESSMSSGRDLLPNLADIQEVSI